MNTGRQPFRCTKDGRYVKCSLSWQNPLSFVEYWARHKPSAIAIASHINENMCITYNWSELLRHCLRLERHIKNLPDTKITLACGAHPLTITLIISALLAGKEILIIDPINQSEQILLYILRHSKTSKLIIPSIEKMPDLLIDKINLIKNNCPDIGIISVGDNPLASQNLLNIKPNAKAKYPDYPNQMWMTPTILVYSPGHHNAPEGFVYTAHALYANMLAISQKFKLSSDTRFFLAGEIDSCYGIAPVLATLAAGGTVILAPKVTERNFWRIIEHNAVNAARITPVLVEKLTAERENKIYRKRGDLKYAIVSGNYLPRRAGLRFYEMFDTPILQCYGTTETGGYVLAPQPGMCNRFYELSLRDNIVGEEFCFCNVRITKDKNINASFDEGEQVGLIQIRGHTVSVGKWTGAKLALWNKPWLETHDLGCKITLNDITGTYYQIKGRIEDALIINGKILWPTNIEQPILATFPFLADCIAITDPDEASDKENNNLYVITVVPSELTDSRRSELLALIQARISAGGVPGLSKEITPDSIVMISYDNIPRRFDNQIDRTELSKQISKQKQGLAAS